MMDALYSLWVAAGPTAVVALALIGAIIAGGAGRLGAATLIALMCGLAACLGAALLGFAALSAGQGAARLLGYVACLLAAIFAVTLISAAANLRAEVGATGAPAPLALILTLGGLLLGHTLLARTTFERFAFLEAASLTAIAAACAAARPRPAAYGAGLWALLVFGAGGVMLAAGVALGQERLAGAIGAALILAGLIARAGAAPVHGPLVGLSVHGGAAAAYLAGFGLALTAMVTLALWVSTIADPLIRSSVATLTAAIAAAGAVWASLQAASAVDLRRFAAFTAASQCGLILAAFVVAAPIGVIAALCHAVAVAAMIVGLHYAAASAATRLGGPVPFAVLDGLGRRRPLAAAALTVCALSAVGAPLTIGFLTKWQLIQAMLSQGWWWGAVVVVVSSLALIVPVGALIERLYFTAADPDAEAPHMSGVAVAPALIVAILASLGFGLNANGLAAWAAHAAEALTTAGAR